MSDTRTQPNGGTATPQPSSLKEFVLGDVWSLALCGLRTVVFVAGVLSVVPLAGAAAGQAGYGYCMKAALTVYGIRLWQRKGQAQVPLVSRQFIDFFISEDSGHYFWYCFFYNGFSHSPLLLFPLVLYTVFLVPKYWVELSKFLSPSFQGTVARVYNVIHSRQPSILRFIASAEIFLMVSVVFSLFSGAGSLMAPVVHYYFLKWRYQSKRNPYVRLMFSDLRVAADLLSSSQRCPSILRNVIQKIIFYFSSLAPPPQTS